MNRVLGLIVLIMSSVMSVWSFAADSELRVATPNDPSIDPHFLYVSTNAAYARHLYGKLVDLDGDGNVIPSLAVEWKNIDENNWELKLREGVKFHDGSDFDAKDVIASFERVPNVPNNPASYVSNTNMIESITEKDPHTIVITTKMPYALLLRRISGIGIIPSEIAETDTTEDFTSGKAAIGTGPYKFSEYVPGDRYVIERNEDFWGEKPAYEKVIFRIMPESASRMAALLGGDVDLLEGLPPATVETLEERDGFYVAQRPSSRTMWLFIDTHNEVSPFVRDNDGNAMDTNPLLDPKVREALSLAINRDAIVERVMGGLAEPANQIVADGWFSHSPNIPEASYDPERAKALLAEAGYPDGFQLTIHGPNDRYPNDEKVVQAIAQMLTRVGIKTEVATMPKSIYFGRMNEREFSLAFIGWDNGLTGSSLMSLSAAFHTRDKDAGEGSWNAGGYSNPEFDAAIEKAEGAFDMDEQEQSLIRAMDIMIAEDKAAVPLYTQFVITGAKDTVSYTPRVDEHFSAMAAKPAE
ncbi:ABC transporter substrate-binding protein [Hoeflea sp. CAU 1731]